MKVKQIVILMMITSICLFSTEGDDLKKSLQKGECKEYYIEDKALDGIIFWMNSVDNLKECSEQEVSLVSSNSVLSIVTSNMLILKKNYHYCKDIKEFSKVFFEKKSKALKMKEKLDTSCKEVSEKKIDYIKKLEKLKKDYIDDEKRLLILKEKKKKIMIIENNTSKIKETLEEQISKTKTRMEEIEKRIEDL